MSGFAMARETYCGNWPGKRQQGTVPLVLRFVSLTDENRIYGSRGFTSTSRAFFRLEYVVLGAVIFSRSRWLMELLFLAKAGADEVQNFFLGHF